MSSDEGRAVGGAGKGARNVRVGKVRGGQRGTGPFGVDRPASLTREV